MVYRRLDRRKRTLVDLKAGVLKDERKKRLWREAKMASSGEMWGNK